MIIKAIDKINIKKQDTDLQFLCESVFCYIDYSIKST
jgi:hypothetical protein